MFRPSMTIGLVAVLTGTAFAQVRPAAQTGPQRQAPIKRVAAQQQQVDPVLWKLLSDWSKASSRIKSLYGKHERHVYNMAFETERISEGEFGYTAPDKGRIQMTPIKITQALIAARNRPGAKVERAPGPDGKPGAPLKLTKDSPERWLCDGVKVYDINDERKEAKVLQLPPDMRGENIMNSPLPFLFGLPPDQAIRRFNITIKSDYRKRKEPFVALEILPRTRRDADSWKKALVMLNTQTFLPTAVKLTDPPGTTKTLYKFTQMKTGRPILQIWRNPWDPKIKDYKIQMITPGEGQQAAAKPPGFPNLVGQAHNVAEDALIKMGIPKANIRKVQAGAAPNDAAKFRVAQQTPQPGTPLNLKGQVVLKIYTAPKVGQVGAPARR